MLEAVGQRWDRKQSIQLESRCPDNQRFDLGDVPGDVRLLLGGLAVGLVGPDPHRGNEVADHRRLQGAARRA